MIILKGGPGVGKSTFMRRIGAAFAERGHAVEYLICSSDPHSLDGVVARKAGFAIIDGTAPHIVDPRLPGAADSLVNLGAFLDETTLSKRKDTIMAFPPALPVPTGIWPQHCSCATTRRQSAGRRRTRAS